jgi:hypothetical protein
MYQGIGFSRAERFFIRAEKIIPPSRDDLRPTLID